MRNLKQERKKANVDVVTILVNKYEKEFKQTFKFRLKDLVCYSPLKIKIINNGLLSKGYSIVRMCDVDNVMWGIVSKLPELEDAILEMTDVRALEKPKAPVGNTETFATEQQIREMIAESGKTRIPEVMAYLKEKIKLPYDLKLARKNAKELIAEMKL